MIYRKWSMLSATAIISGGIAATVIVGNFLFIENDWMRKPQEKKSDTPTK